MDENGGAIVMPIFSEKLRDVFGENAQFRDSYQEEAVRKIVDKKRVLVVQKTGWGKSLVYFLATKILRQRGEGATIIISPLLSLARNQIESTKKYGIIAASINSSENKTHEEREFLVNECNNGRCDVLFITPEQLQKEEFISLLSRLKMALFVVDEAHCISDWGHDFRPDYRRIRQLLNILPGNIGVLATTATANNRVIEDVAHQLGDCDVIRGPLLRESLNLHKVYMPTTEEKYAWILKNINNLPGSGIIYATTIKECDRLAQFLQTNSIAAYPYHANLNDQVKIDLEQKLINNELKVLVSTIALGMGFDKDDIGFVIHYYTPKSLIEYYQQIGRAGRNIKDSYCVLLYGGQEETKINEYFIFNSFPKHEDMLAVVNCIANSNGMKEREIASSVNIKSTVLGQILKLLLIEGIIAKNGPIYLRTPKQYIPQTQYYSTVIENKVVEFNELINYQQETGCLMSYVTHHLNDPYYKSCYKCSNCMGKWDITEDVVFEDDKKIVKEFFKNQFILIEPRKQSSITGGCLKYLCEPGLALSYYHEELGQEARRGKYTNNYFSEILVQASAEKLKKFLYQNKLDSNTVIVPIPSNRRPQLVSNFAERLAKQMKCEFADILSKHPNEPEQKSALNSQLQETNIRNHLHIKDFKNLHNKHIILVDDFVDSRWTFAVAAELLLTSYTTSKVIPFAISDTSSSD